MIKVLTYNIHSAIGMDNQADWRRIAEVIGRTGADVVGLEEVTVNHAMMKDVNVPRQIGEFLKVNWVFGKALAINEGKGEYGIAAFSPHPMRLVREIRLPVPANHEPRLALVLKIDAPRPYYFIVTHFSYDGEYPDSETNRVEAVKVITAAVKEGKYAPAIMVGDFNSFPDAPCLNAARREWTICNDVNPELSFPSDTPNQLIDYICCYPKAAFKVDGVRVIAETMASDHRPVLAELSLNPAD